MPKENDDLDDRPPGTVPFDDEEFAESRLRAASKALVPRAAAPFRVVHVLTAAGPGPGRRRKAAFATFGAARRAMLAEQAAGAQCTVEAVALYKSYAAWRTARR